MANELNALLEVIDTPPVTEVEMPTPATEIREENPRIN
jgi:hypothetical protein